MRRNYLSCLLMVGLMGCSGGGHQVGHTGGANGQAGGPGGLPAGAGQSGAAGLGLGGAAGTASAGGGMGGIGISSGSGGNTGPGGAAGQGVAGSTGGTTLPGLRLLAGGLGGPGNLDGVGAAARFSGATGVASDGAGNCYVADTSSQTIRKISLATGAVTTLAGVPGINGGTDASGAANRLAAPTGLAYDGAGSLYVAEAGAIGKVVLATGAVSTLTSTANWAGNGMPPSSAPQCTAVLGDGAGSLYVVNVWFDDIGNYYYLSKVAIASGVATSLAGWYSASSSPVLNAIATDGAGSVYLGDDTHAVLKVSGTSGAVTTIAGSSSQFGGASGADASAALDHPGSTASDGAGNLYVVDQDTVWKVVIATGVVSRVAGVGSSNGIASDGAGNLCVSTNQSMQKVVIATGAVTTLAGAASRAGSTDAAGAGARFNQPSGIASDGAGNLYVADTGNGTIRKVVVATGAVTTLAGSAGSHGPGDGVGARALFNRPVAITSDGAGNLYVTDGLTIRKITIATQLVTTLAVGPNGGAGEVDTASIASDGAGNIYFDQAGTTIWMATAAGELTFVAGMTGQSGSDDGIGASASFFSVTGLVSDRAGNLYVSDTGNGTIRKIVLATGAVTTLAGAANQPGVVDGTGKSARFSNPHNIAYDGAGNLYVGDGNTVRKIVLATATVSTVIGAPTRAGVSLGPLPASLNVVQGIVALPTGELAIVDGQENAVLLARF